MTHVAEDGTIWAAAEPPGRCQDCGQVAETRPYGPNYSQVCVRCAKKDPAATERRMGDVLEGRHRP